MKRAPEYLRWDEPAAASSAFAQPSFGNLLPYNPTSSSSPGPPRVAVGDFNSDGLPDVAVTGRSDFACVQILLGDGRGNYRESSAQDHQRFRE